MIGNNLWPADVRANLLHILPQPTYHFPARIFGSPAALKRLGEALIAASSLKQGGQGEVAMMAADGEGYAIEIQPMSDQQMDKMPLPYAQLGQTWNFERCWNCDKAQAALAKATP